MAQADVSQISVRGTAEEAQAERARRRSSGPKSASDARIPRQSDRTSTSGCSPGCGPTRQLRARRCLSDRLNVFERSWRTRAVRTAEATASGLKTRGAPLRPLRSFVVSSSKLPRQAGNSAAPRRRQLDRAHQPFVAIVPDGQTRSVGPRYDDLAGCGDRDRTGPQHTALERLTVGSDGEAVALCGRDRHPVPIHPGAELLGTNAAAEAHPGTGDDRLSRLDPEVSGGRSEELVRSCQVDPVAEAVEGRQLRPENEGTPAGARVPRRTDVVAYQELDRHPCSPRFRSSGRAPPDRPGWGRPARGWKSRPARTCSGRRRTRRAGRSRARRAVRRGFAPTGLPSRERRSLRVAIPGCRGARSAGAG